MKSNEGEVTSEPNVPVSETNFVLAGCLMEDPTISMVDSFLQLCEERQLLEASKLLANGAKLVFPGGAVFDDLNALVSDSKSRYHEVRKTRDEYSVGTRASDGAQVCVSTGTLFGTTLWGTKFSGVRYIDVFIIRDGLIQEQHVWNDLAEVGAVPIFGQRHASLDQ